ncbi:MULTISPECIES: lipopolysaccharide transport periplasmic protein LptA [unclassified Arsukibacterium]|uniref:lipopolysaccharide transport periplasmic protein LptA n=1 Tax=unclassified Arsukibacterium TaxID=2635278 RepID=UPI000C4D2106|nr:MULTISPECIES: lipopolysaccharide transport periplasmic protein LptA [unclassified Arsukibacterium]MAA94154.1 lipopolysaccharide transport periplasmic protein LptA [Rheinheimera sp.]MBM34168.1 lipopolysaccharide transport periplasmic protein LptA [Rheinheimera sp.]HAW92455.1 lipopolysaccharide transport periplasmic protein LptA [Candidatus Azambacteria bacterium]|tara:strand:+ start:121502 stop:121996 length:495 start_codon:yes stop_codon:yes gene_type:complete
MNRINLFFLTALLSANCFAVDADYSQPIAITSDNNETSIKDYVSVYTQNVEVRQGSLHIKADRLEINASAGKGNEVFITTGTPVQYSQLLEGEIPVTATAAEIRYDLASRTLTLSGNAQLSQSGSEVQAAVIRYNIETQQISAESGEQKKRVTTIFTPQTKENP